MTDYLFRLWTARCLFAVLVFSVLALGAVERWAQTSVEILLFSAAAIWVLRRAWAPFHLEWSVLAAPIAVIGCVAALQFAFDWTTDRYSTGAELIRWSAYLVFFCLAVNVLADTSILRGFRYALVCFGFALALFGIVQFYTSPEEVYWAIPAPGGRPFGPFADRNHFAIFIELVLPVALLLALREKDKRLVYFVLCGLMLAAVILTGSRAGSVIVAAELGAFLVVAALGRSSRGGRLRRWNLAQLAILIAVAGALMYAAGPWQVAEKFEETERSTARFEVALRTWEVFLTEPLTGYGMGTFQEVYPAFSEFHNGFVWNHAHSDSVQLAMEAGAGGVVALLLMIGLLLWRTRTTEQFLGVLLPLFAAWIHSWVEFPLQMTPLVLTALVLVAMAAAKRAPSPRDLSLSHS